MKKIKSLALVGMLVTGVSANAGMLNTDTDSLEVYKTQAKDFEIVTHNTKIDAMERKMLLTVLVKRAKKTVATTLEPQKSMVEGAIQTHLNSELSEVEKAVNSNQLQKANSLVQDGAVYWINKLN